MVKVGVDSLDAAIKYLMRQYGEEVNDQLKSDLQYVGELTANEVSRMSPRRTGKYGPGWDYSFSARGGEFKVVVHNTSKPSLTHLLEKGHMTRGGGHWVSGRKHIEPAYERGSNELEKRLRNG